MSRIWWWLRRRISPDHSAEAEAHLRRLDERSAEIEQLGAAATEQLRANHFSEMVTMAIRRRAERGT